MAELLEQRPAGAPSRSSGAGARVPPALEPLAQSVFLEALRNADRHPQASAMTVRVGRSADTFELEVPNDGVRPRPGGVGLGLRLLTLEALQHNGLLEFGPVGEGGWRVKLSVAGR